VVVRIIMWLNSWKSGGESFVFPPPLQSVVVTDMQGSAIPRLRLGHGGYHRSPGKLYRAQALDCQLMIANKQEGYAL